MATAVSAGGLAVTGGSPATNKYLVGSDANGSVTWSVLRASDGTAGATEDKVVRNADGTGTTTLHLKNGLYAGSD